MAEQDLTLGKNENVAEVYSNSFINVVSNLNIPKYQNKSVNIDHTEDRVTRSIERYKNHPSIIPIKSKWKNKYSKFNSISKSEIEKELLNLDSLKAFQDSDLPTDIFTDALYSEFNRSLETSVTPVYKKGNRS